MGALDYVFKHLIRMCSGQMAVFVDLYETALDQRQGDLIRGARSAMELEHDPCWRQRRARGSYRDDGRCTDVRLRSNRDGARNRLYDR